MEQIVEIGLDGMCKCSCGDECPLGKMGMQTRCTEIELRRERVALSRPDGYRCDFCLVRAMSADDFVETLHYKFGSVRLCKSCYKVQGNNVR